MLILPEELDDKSLARIGNPDASEYGGYRVTTFRSKVLNISECHAQLEIPLVCAGQYDKPWMDLSCDPEGTSPPYRQAVKFMLQENRYWFAYACRTEGIDPPAAIRVQKRSSGITQP